MFVMADKADIFAEEMLYNLNARAVSIHLLHDEKVACPY